jgi:hypothetical protein
MRKSLIVILVSVVAVAVLASAALAAPPPQPRNFVTALSGGEEVPAVHTRARGVATFQLSADGSALSYRLIASNIENVHMAHIHLGARGENGPVVVWLHPVPGPPPGPADSGRQNGVLATGTITAANLVGPLQGAPFSALVDALIAGGAYVNVHTSSTTIPLGEPGNNPAGEIRGQID